MTKREQASKALTLMAKAVRSFVSDPHAFKDVADAMLIIANSFNLKEHEKWATVPMSLPGNDVCNLSATVCAAAHLYPVSNKLLIMITTDSELSMLLCMCMEDVARTRRSHGWPTGKVIAVDGTQVSVELQFGRDSFTVLLDTEDRSFTTGGRNGKNS